MRSKIARVGQLKLEILKDKIKREWPKGGDDLRT